MRLETPSEVRRLASGPVYLYKYFSGYIFRMTYREKMAWDWERNRQRSMTHQWEGYWLMQGIDPYAT